MLTLTRRSVATLAVVGVLAAGCGDDDDDTAATDDQTEEETTTTTEAEAEAPGDVLEVAAAEGDLATFLAGLEAAGNMDDFHGDGPFTLFVPTDAAFADYLGASGMTQDEVFSAPEMIKPLLDYHVVQNMAEDSEMVMGMAGQSLTMANGQPLQVTVEGETVMVGNATVERYDIEASNGVIHVIDAVLMPPAA